MMMSLEVIQAVNRKAARESLRRGIQPVLITKEALASVSDLRELSDKGVKLPHIGYRHPRGFVCVGEAVFIDTSGFGQSDEPALTFSQTLAHMRRMTDEHGPLYWATTEMGQFQGYLQALRKGKK